MLRRIRPDLGSLEPQIIVVFATAFVNPVIGIDADEQSFRVERWCATGLGEAADGRLLGRA